MVASIVDSELMNNAIAFAKKQFQNDFSGHDFHHTMRVFHLASAIAVKENANLAVVQLAALLHDVDDSKLFGGSIGQSENARRFLTENDCPIKTMESICHIISEISFKGIDTVVPDSIEGKIVQDADRLDAIGAIGIARAFAFGGSRSRSLFFWKLRMTAIRKAWFTCSMKPVGCFHRSRKILRRI